MPLSIPTEKKRGIEVGNLMFLESIERVRGMKWANCLSNEKTWWTNVESQIYKDQYKSSMTKIKIELTNPTNNKRNCKPLAYTTEWKPPANIYETTNNATTMEMYLELPSYSTVKEEFIDEMIVAIQSISAKVIGRYNTDVNIFP